MSDPLPPHRTRMLPTRHLGRKLLIFPQASSTNTLALSLGTDPSQHGVVLIAEEQTAGRGQYGRLWQAPPRSGVLMSVLLFPPAALRRPALIVAWAAVSVCETITQLTGRDATIKWPNDVLLAGKKICGILIEQRTSGNADWPLATVAGIGLNVAQSAEAFAEAELPDAGSLFSMTGVACATEDVAVRLIGQLDDEYGRLLEGDVARLEGVWQRRLGLLGRQVRVEAVDRELHGRLVELTLDGLRLETAGGETVRLAPEAVRHIWSAAA
jgi:BirA family biotin operon repressor/biotin-[acetyl-CoA-carboxylase] ligase